MAKCTAITRAGTTCKGIPIDGSSYCFVHHPDHAEERRRYGSKGGKRGGRGRPQVQVNTVKDHLWTLAEDTLSGKVDKGVAAVVNQILGTYLKACGVGLDVEERQELLERLEQLEEQMRAKTEAGRRGA
jgi:hypothetical protein